MFSPSGWVLQGCPLHVKVETFWDLLRMPQHGESNNAGTVPIRVRLPRDEDGQCRIALHSVQVTVLCSTWGVCSPISSFPPFCGMTTACLVHRLEGNSCIVSCSAGILHRDSDGHMTLLDPTNLSVIKSVPPFELPGGIVSCCPCSWGSPLVL